jgi:tRNA(Ile)-lysidine synthase
MNRRATLWQRRAVAFGSVVARAGLHPAVLAWAESAAKSDRWAVALSGGADSVALLLGLWAHWPERREQLIALHFDHDLRGRESRGDAAFCRRLCAGLGVPLVEERWRRSSGPVSEGTARAARFAFFESALGSRRIRTLWLGQQQDDVAETLIMRLARGSGTAGLAAPRPVHRHGLARVHLRPLLTLKKAEIEAALQAAGARWRCDSTNAGGDFFRNRVRNTVVAPWMEAAGRDALAGAALSRELLEEDDQALETWVDRLDFGRGADGMDVTALVGLPRAVMRRALHRWLMESNRVGELSRQGFDRLLAAVELGRPTRHSLGNSVFAVIANGRLAVVRRRA